MRLRVPLYPFRVMASITRREWDDPASIIRFQTERLRKVLRSANRLPYYREVFAGCNIDPESCTMEQFSRLPILTKDVVQQHFPETYFRQVTSERLRSIRTSGSTGTPLTIVMNRRERAFRAGVLWYGARKLGVRYLDSICQIGGLPSTLRALGAEHHSSLLNRLGIRARYYLDMKHDVAYIADRLSAFKPHVLIALPSFLALLGQYLRDHHRALPTVRLIWSGGEVLMPSSRQLIESAFGCSVVNMYSSFELGLMAYECTNAHLHSIPDATILEVVNRNADGVGDVVVTSLSQHTMPLIRYGIGDRIKVSSSPCPCGVPFEAFEDIEGRANDLLVLPSGARMSWRAIGEFRNIPGIVQYQIIQRKTDHVQVYIQKNDHFTEASVCEIKRRVQRGYRGELVHVDVIEKTLLERAPGGKLRAVISEVGMK